MRHLARFNEYYYPCEGVTIFTGAMKGTQPAQPLTCVSISSSLILSCNRTSELNPSNPILEASKYLLLKSVYGYQFLSIGPRPDTAVFSYFHSVSIQIIVRCFQNFFSQLYSYIDFWFIICFRYLFQMFYSLALWFLCEGI